MRRHLLELVLILAVVAVGALALRPPTPTPPAPTAPTGPPERDVYLALLGQVREGLVPLGPIWDTTVVAFPNAELPAGLDQCAGPRQLKDVLRQRPLLPLPFLAPTIATRAHASEFWRHRTREEWENLGLWGATLASLSPVAFNENRTEALVGFSLFTSLADSGYLVESGYAWLAGSEGRWKVKSCDATSSNREWDR